MANNIFQLTASMLIEAYQAHSRPTEIWLFSEAHL